MYAKAISHSGFYNMPFRTYHMQDQFSICSVPFREIVFQFVPFREIVGPARKRAMWHPPNPDPLVSPFYFQVAHKMIG